LVQKRKTRQWGGWGGEGKKREKGEPEVFNLGGDGFEKKGRGAKTQKRGGTRDREILGKTTPNNVSSGSKRK